MNSQLRAGATALTSCLTFPAALPAGGGAEPRRGSRTGAELPRERARVANALCGEKGFFRRLRIRLHDDEIALRCLHPRLPKAEIVLLCLHSQLRGNEILLLCG